MNNVKSAWKTKNGRKRVVGKSDSELLEPQLPNSRIIRKNKKASEVLAERIG